MKTSRLSPPNPSFSTSTLVVLPLAALATIIVIVYPNEFALQSFFGVCHDADAIDLTTRAVAAPDFRLLIGVLTLPSRYERRHMLRMVYSLQPPVTAHIDVRFVFCNIPGDDQRVLVALEAMRYGDVVVLDCPENMDNGKTYTYFSSVPKLFNGTAEEGGGRSAYDFVMKTDDDTFFRLPQLVESLNKAPREDLYYGCLVPCDYIRPWNEYMSGMGYVLSWDLVEWIAAAEEIKNRTVGPEDRTLYSWLKGAGKAKNRFDTKPAMYNFPSRDPCAHELVPDTIAVHQIKDNWRWAVTLKYFNFTSAFKPSKFYPIS